MVCGRYIEYSYPENGRFSSAVIIYLVWRFITVLFITQTSPFTVFSKLWEMIKSNTKEDDDNRSVMKGRQLLSQQKKRKDRLGRIKLNAGVPIIDTAKEKELIKESREAREGQ